MPNMYTPVLAVERKMLNAANTLSLLDSCFRLAVGFKN